MQETFGKIFRPKLLLIYLLVFAFLVRIVGIGYGLPLWLVDDEPPFTLAALKMLQLKTLLRVFHLEEFKTVLYYPPYLSYWYLLPFSVLLGIKYLLFSGGQEQFIYYLTGDLSQFFLIARFLNVLMGVASVYLLYRVAKNILPSDTSPDSGMSEFIGLTAAFFLGTSLFHAMLSSVGRHWLPVSFIFLLSWYYLTNKDFSFKKRFSLGLLIAGLGIGISPITVLLIPLIVFWLFFQERNNLLSLFKEKYFYGIVLIFIILAILPSILYPQSFGFRGDLTPGATKSALGILQSPFLFLKPVALSEPILTIFSIFGLLFVFFKQKAIFWPLFIFIYIYSGIFYWFFRYEHRFTITLIPILALLAGIGFAATYRRIANQALRRLFLVILPLLMIFSLRFAYLMNRNDSRLLLREWAEQNIPAGEKILVYSRLTRLSATKEAIQEQELLDSNSLRKVDVSEINFAIPDKKYFHALNLHDVNNQEFYDNLEKYARDRRYRYVFFGGTDAQEMDRLESFRKLSEGGVLLKSFGEFQEEYSPAIGQLLGNPLRLFQLKEFGPPVSVYKINL